MLHKSISAKRTAVIIALVMLMMTALGSFNASYATLYASPASVQTNSVTSSTNYTDEYYKVSTPEDEAKTIYVEGRTKIKTERFCIRMKKEGVSNYAITVFVDPDKNGEFSVKISTASGTKQLPEIIDGKGAVVTADMCYDTRPGYRAVENMPPGIYHLTIARATNAKEAALDSDWYHGPLGGTVQGYAYKEAVLTVANGQNNNPKVVKYNKAITNNKNVTNSLEKNKTHIDAYKGSYVRYTDPKLTDMSFVLKNPATGKTETITAEKAKYIKNIADQVTKGAATNYEKLAKIYEFTASNFYYDKLANEKYKNQYANPYRNLYNLKNKVKSANSVNGKVATTCQGYSAIVIALARAEGIPARLANGHHISQPLKTWANVSGAEIQKRDHWWAEAWAENRWIFIDANAATDSKWTRTSFSAAGEWTKKDNINYAHFDPTPEQLSASYSYNEIYPGSTASKFINTKTEVNQLRTFLNTKSSGVTNGKRLNKNYKSANLATWGTIAADDFVTDGYGRTTKIMWGGKKLAGKLNLSNFKKLRLLSVYSSNITSINLTGCNALEKVSAKSTKLTTAKIKTPAKLITISRNIAGGTFSFDYNKSKTKKLTIYASKAKAGYKYLGIYNGAGKKLTSKTTYSCNPTAAKYVVKYKKK